MLRVGTQVRETETDPEWKMTGPGEVGTVIARADDEMGLPGHGRFWMVRWSFGDFIQLDTEIEVI